MINRSKVGDNGVSTNGQVAVLIESEVSMAHKLAFGHWTLTSVVVGLNPADSNVGFSEGLF